jgi:ABC-type glycerol-3-phosphate transport system substrate-binding protein
MKGMSKFQLILTGVFGAFILIGVLVFALYRGSDNAEVSKAVVWGTMSESLFSSFLFESGLDQDETVNITYVQKRRETFDQDFVEALAVGRGPDLFFLPQDSIVKHQDKIITIPFSSLSERTFKDSYIEAAEVYLTSAGTLGVPFMVDPLVMYWNRDMFTNAGLSQPPKTWSDFYELSTKLTSRDSNLNISKSAIAFGEYGNVANANEILGLLILQAGNPITTRAFGSESDPGPINNLFAQQFGLTIAPAVQSLNFYTEFANPLKPFYSWNRSLPNSKVFFLSGDLAVYFGFTSELSDLRLKNPNLNFSVSPVPQTRGTERATTFGRMVALAVPINSPNATAAFQVAAKMTSPESIEVLSRITNLPPVRRGLLVEKPADLYKSVFYEAAVQSKAWLAPETAKLNDIFREMVESVTAGRTSTSQAVSKASDQIGVVLNSQ